MYVTEWKEEIDGSYHEAIVSLREGLTPIFKIRAVKMIDGQYMAVVRDHKTGHMVASRAYGINKGLHLEVAQNTALELVSMVIIGDGFAQCVVKEHRRVCPHLSISGLHCSYCKIPDFV